MHQHEEIHSPELSKYLIQQINQHCGTSIPEPVFVEQDQLFGTVDIPKKKTTTKTKASSD